VSETKITAVSIFSFEDAVSEWKEIYGTEPDEKMAHHFFNWGRMITKELFDSLHNQITAEATGSRVE